MGGPTYNGAEDDEKYKNHCTILTPGCGNSRDTNCLMCKHMLTKKIGSREYCPQHSKNPVFAMTRMYISCRKCGEIRHPCENCGCSVRPNEKICKECRIKYCTECRKPKNLDIHICKNDFIQDEYQTKPKDLNICNIIQNGCRGCYITCDSRFCKDCEEINRYYHDRFCNVAKLPLIGKLSQISEKKIRILANKYGISDQRTKYIIIRQLIGIPDMSISDISQSDKNNDNE